MHLPLRSLPPVLTPHRTHPALVQIYVCIPACSKFRSAAVDTIFLKNGFLRLGLYVICSILTFHGKSVNILSGVCMILTGLCFLMAYLVEKMEEREAGQNTTYNAVPGERVPISGAGFTPSAASSTAGPADPKSGAYDF